ncbi:mold-specific M46 protein [Colletotrichum plurivorum]|uniref:Mold-specific M46 protein n=1 Tax=Colletotrichum plurivorum TaxID=2175906 RepID=A0A8H6KAX9_9PEZI|nr:mold-specific M46 protein [Colletotrichum plurivorum]
MRFTTFLTALLLAATAHAGVAPHDPSASLSESHSDNPSIAELLDPRGEPVEKRACKENGCKCNSRGKQLTICGACVWTDTKMYAITTKRVDSHIYECSPGGKCCDYGYAKDCGTGSGRCIIN